jgi:hypothetical protein
MTPWNNLAAAGPTSGMGRRSAGFHRAFAWEGDAAGLSHSDASALITAGRAAQVPYHLARSMHNDLTRAQASEVIAHLAFYAGRPSAFSAVPAVKSAFDSRAD